MEEPFPNPNKHYFPGSASLVMIFIFLWLCACDNPVVQNRHSDKGNRLIATENVSDLYIRQVYPGKSIPDKGYYQAFRKFRTQGSRAVETVYGESWKSIGPTNQAGRILSLAVHPEDPNIVFAGSASGGLWKLTITGDGWCDYHWEMIETGFPVLGVASIAINPADPDIMFIGTGEAFFHKDYYIPLNRLMYTYGIGLLKTTDGGVTWKKSIDWTENQSRGVLSLSIKPGDPDVIFAGTTEGLFRSMDAGQNWEQIHDTLMTMDIEINPTCPDTMFITCGNAGTPGPGIFRSCDGGDTWTRLSGGLPDYWEGKVMLDMYRDDPSVIYADIYDLVRPIGIDKTEDNGDSWNFVSNELMGDAMGFYAHYLRVNPQDTTKLFKGNIHYGYSEDGGGSWTVMDEPGAYSNDSSFPHVDHHVFANHPHEPNAFFIGNDGGVWRTRDNGKSFQDLNHGLVTSQFYPGFASSPYDSGYAIGGMQDNGSAMYTGSENWETFILNGDGGHAAFEEDNIDTVYAGLYLLSIFKSNDRAKNFRFIGPVNFWGEDPEIPPSARDPHEDEWSRFPCPFYLLPGGIMYAATNYVYKSYDYGETWTCCNYDRAIYDIPIISMAVSRKNTDYVYCATLPYPQWNVGPELFVTRDGGSTWSNIGYQLPDRYIILSVSPHNENVIYAAVGGFGTDHVYRSFNAGETWNSIGKGLPDVPTNVVRIDPEHYQNIYIGNDLGVWVSTDDGGSWDPFLAGLPEACIVTDLSIVPVNRKIRAATHGNGVFEASLLPAGAPEDIVLDVPLQLNQNYPNPFRETTTISFMVPQSSELVISIYDIQGRFVTKLSEANYSRGLNTLEWDGTGDDGNKLSGGLYICALKSNDQIYTKKMILFW